MIVSRWARKRELPTHQQRTEAVTARIDASTIALTVEHTATGDTLSEEELLSSRVWRLRVGTDELRLLRPYDLRAAEGIVEAYLAAKYGLEVTQWHRDDGNGYMPATWHWLEPGDRPANVDVAALLDKVQGE
jgi:hypothetical protein